MHTAELLSLLRRQVPMLRGERTAGLPDCLQVPSRASRAPIFGLCGQLLRPRAVASRSHSSVLVKKTGETNTCQATLLRLGSGGPSSRPLPPNVSRDLRAPPTFRGISVAPETAQTPRGGGSGRCGSTPWGGGFSGSLLKGPRGPLKGPRGPLKGSRGPLKGSRGPFKRPGVL